MLFLKFDLVLPNIDFPIFTWQIGHRCDEKSLVVLSVQMTTGVIHFVSGRVKWTLTHRQRHILIHAIPAALKENGGEQHRTVVGKGADKPKRKAWCGYRGVTKKFDAVISKSKIIGRYYT